MSLLKIDHLYPLNTSELLWDVDVVHGDYPADKRCIRAKGIWDTGASDTAVVIGLVKALELKMLDLPPRYINTANGVFLSHAYEANISLSAKYRPIKMTVWDMPPGNIDVLIGMDIISKGNFVLNRCHDGIFFSFEI